MRDAGFLIVVAAFFALATSYVRACRALIEVDGTLTPLGDDLGTSEVAA